MSPASLHAHPTQELHAQIHATNMLPAGSLHANRSELIYVLCHARQGPFATTCIGVECIVLDQI